jgi:hypothetical protein
MAKNNLARLRRNFPLIKALEKSSNNGRKRILKNSNPELIKTICDICYNLTKGNIDLPESKRRKLGRYKKELRRLGDKKISLNTKRKEIVQKGGFLSAIIPAVSIAASLISGLLSK